MATQTTKTISFTKELDEELNNFIKTFNENKIDGSLTQSKIIRVALSEFLEKQKRVQKLLEEYSDVNKTAEQLLKENGML